MEERKVLFVIAFDGFNNIEYCIPKRIVEDAGFQVTTASDRAGTAVAKDGATALVDYALDKIDSNDYCGLFFIGGPGAECLDNSTSYKIIQECLYQHKPIGAICIATRILAAAGALHEKNATGWNEDGKLGPILDKCDAHYIADQDVVVDNNIITATGPAVARKFGKTIVDVLQKKQSWG